ncbi:MAG: hypothetical protein NZT92_23135 [Abditibacteriales bacterium]|nr:hypothetical protein [Abditibacteriales bacterium]MDW8368180.1 hypothetical protein [Abditibacteriales bacterium]
MRFKFILPLPPSLHQQYSAHDGRRFLSADAAQYKVALEHKFLWLYLKGLLRGDWTKNFDKEYLRLRYEFYFASPFRCYLDSGLKLAQDLVCGGLRVNESRIVDIEMVKRVDKYHPRLVVIFEVLKDWDFSGESSLFYEEEAVTEEINCLEDSAVRSAALTADLMTAGTPVLAGAVDPNGNGHNGSNAGQVTNLDELMRRFHWR